MDPYDSDSSVDDADAGTSTSVLLGYATDDQVDDTLSRLGGKPQWIDDKAPSFALAQCKTCTGPLSLLLQLNGELPGRFPGHERQLYIWACRKKVCRRKPGSIRAVRATRASKPDNTPRSDKAEKPAAEAPKQGLGSAIFGGSGIASSSSSNPFSSNPLPSNANPFASNPFTTSGSSTAGLASKPPQKPAPDLAATFAEKARISSPSALAAQEDTPAPWPTDAAHLARPFPQFHLDAEYEYLSAEPAPIPTATQAAFLDTDEGGQAGSSKKEDDKLYEDAHDKTFQKFADVLSQNPEQVLRYEFAGAPLLYSRGDQVGALLSGNKGMPACQYCGAGRVFEVQLTPQAIVELESEEGTADMIGEGMEWGAVIMGVCGRDCYGGNGHEGEVVYREEWCGVQWEEIVERRKT